jgi:hypothetical protein
MYLRDVALDPRYEQDFEDLRRLYPEMEQVQAYIEYSLSDNPRQGHALPVSPDFFVMTTSAVGATPPFNILYTFDTEKIVLLSIAVIR